MSEKSDTYDVKYEPLGAIDSGRKKRKTSKAWILVGAVLGSVSAFNLWSHYGVTNFVESKEEAKNVIFDALKTNLAGEWSKKYTAEPHLAGTNYGLVQWTADKFEEYGWEPTVDEYEVLLSYPNDHDLNLIGKSGEVVYKAPLKEDVLKDDETTEGDDLVPTFLGYGANGNVTAEYVYVNYGSREDFEQLKEWGIDVKGKIVIARYGKIFRGLKIQFAQDAGAIGVLLYTDPGDDHGITPANGYKQYPEGPARQESSVQRGSVQFLGGVGAAPGDPTTPGYASKPGVERQDPYDSIGKIPALPISYREVKPILKKLNNHGTKADKTWEGELESFKYYTGPNKDFKLNLYSDQIYNISTLYNVYGKIEGRNKNEVIIVGNHRDAWIKGGAGDPNSGSAVLIEVARALGELKKRGHEFERTIILHSYDGEEYGLLGSTEQGEYFAKKYQANVVAYVNLDVAVSGKHLDLSASPLLNEVLRAAAKEVEYPEKDVGTVYDHYVKEKGDKIKNLGLGSDYAVYLDHLGIPSVDLGFKEGKGDPIYHYHSNYDSYHWISEFADPGFVYHNLAAKYLSLITLFLSDREIVHFEVNSYAQALKSYFDTVSEKVPKKWFNEVISPESSLDYLSYDKESVEYVKEASNGVFVPKSPFPFMELLKTSECPHNKVMQMFDVHEHEELTIGDVIEHTYAQLEKLNNETLIFDSNSLSLQEQWDNWDDLKWYKKLVLLYRTKGHNAILKYFERNFLHHAGLHNRPWFKHIVYAGGRYTGYAGQTLPGLLEALEDGEIDRFVHWLGVVSKTFKRINDVLSSYSFE